MVSGTFACEDFLRRAFQLAVQGGELKEAFNKVVKVPKIIAVKESHKNTIVAPASSNGNLRNGAKEIVHKQNSISS